MGIRMGSGPALGRWLSWSFDGEMGCGDWLLATGDMRADVPLWMGVAGLRKRGSELWLDHHHWGKVRHGEEREGKRLGMVGASRLLLILLLLWSNPVPIGLGMNGSGVYGKVGRSRRKRRGSRRSREERFSGGGEERTGKEAVFFCSNASHFPVPPLTEYVCTDGPTDGDGNVSIAEMIPGGVRSIPSCLEYPMN